MAVAPSAASADQFLGVMADGPLGDGSVNVGEQVGLMARAHVQTVRVGFYWSQAQPFSPGTALPAGLSKIFQDIHGVSTTFVATDKIVAACARHRLQVLPVVVQAPPWARTDPSKEWSPPDDVSAYAAYVAALVSRYGPAGSFWRAHRRLRRTPIRYWQIWNEPAGGDRPNGPSIFWDDPNPFQEPYIALLRAARQAALSVDPHARIVLGGLFGRSWESLESLYKHGARGLFDVVAIHPYARSPAESLHVTSLVKATMRRNGDGARPVFVTELSWNSAAGRLSGTNPLATTKDGQARDLLRAFRLFAEQRKRLGVERVYWYTWIGRDASTTSQWDYSGLLHLSDSGSVSPKPAFAAFRRIGRWVAAGARPNQAPS